MKSKLIQLCLFLPLFSAAQMTGVDIRSRMLQEGLSPERIEQILERRKNAEFMNAGLGDSIHSNNTHSKVASTFCDMSVETGWSTWQWRTGTNIGGNPPKFNQPWSSNPVAVPGYHITNGNGLDPNGGFPVVCPGYGSYSLQMGDSCEVGGVVEQLKFSFIVTPSETNFRFAYAAVIQHAGMAHEPHEQPFVSLCIYDHNGHAIPVLCFSDTGSANMTSYLPVTGQGCANPNGSTYRPWTKDSADLTPYVGQTISVVLTNADCPFGGHFSYSFFDFLCKESHTGVNEIGTNDLSVFPNPSEGKFTLSVSPEMFGLGEIIIYNEIGISVFQKRMMLSDDEMVDAGSLPDGVYLLKISSERNTSYKKLIIQAQ